MYKIPLSRPSITPAEAQAAYDTVMSRQLAQGPKVAEFEQRMAEYVGTKYAVAVSSGTAGLYLCLKACGIGQGDEVITTPYTFVATVNSILWAGARPVFCDIDRDTYNMDTKNKPAFIDPKITKAIIPVDVFGSPIDTNYWLYGSDKDNKCEYRYCPKIILDSCESLGSRMARPFDSCVYAFYPNKQITTGEGGMVCTNNIAIAEYIRAARNQGRLPGDTWLISSIMGYNFRLTDVAAAIGIEQLKRIDEILDKRRHIALTYTKMLGDLYIFGKIGMQTISEETSPFVFAVEVPDRPRVMRYLAEHGIETRAYFPCVTDMPHIKALGYRTEDYPVAKEISEKTLALPFYADMTEGEVDYVCEALKNALK